MSVPHSSAGSEYLQKRIWANGQRGGGDGEGGVGSFSAAVFACQAYCFSFRYMFA